tara:strand:- start:3980 stop:5623 length:1644 start_codon:yes stop_codon:yes gene_type:complete
MKLFQNYVFEKYILIFLALFYILGIVIVSDYGISWDESAQRMHGFINGNYIIKTILSDEIYNKILSDVTNIKFSDISKDPPDLASHKGRAYGIFYQLPIAIMETVFKIDDDRSIYLFRHFINFSFFFVSAIYFYKYLKLIFEDKTLLCFLGLIFLIANPRIFANSFYNPKDIIFLSLFIISNYYGLIFLKNKNLKSCIIFSICSAALITTRTFGLVVPFVISIMFFYEFITSKNKKIFNLLVINMLFVLLFTYIFWPYLWEDPLNRFLYVIQFFSQKSNEIQMLYFGNKILSTDLPWHYLLIYLAISNPGYLITSFIIGLIFFFKSISKNKTQNYMLIYKFLMLVFFLVIPIILVTQMNTALYNGWRHFYFLLPTIIIFSLIFVDEIIKLKKNKLLKLFFIFMLGFNFLFTLFWSIKNHPYQNVFYNNFFGPKPNLSFFSKDYYGLSNKQLIQYLVKFEKSDEIYYDFLGSNFYLSLKMFDSATQNKFKLDRNNKDNDQFYYLFYNNNYPNDEIIFNEKTLDKKVEAVKEIKIDDVVINGVYKIYKN